jgi:2-(1,2-epoxy-1,2-dihydrophenyl)acetyl-CoA isomerase
MVEGSYAGFKVEMKDAHVALLTFNKPERLNGLHIDTKRDLVEAMLQAQLDDEVRVVVMTGEGKGFCAGDDVRGGYWGDEAGWAKAKSRRVSKQRHDGFGSYSSLRATSQAVNRAILDLDKITIAAVNGYAVQSGLSLALACDFRIASTAAKPGSATLRMGYLPDEGGHHLLVRHIGVAKTLEFLLKNRIVDGVEAKELGLVHEAVAPEMLMPRAMEFAREIAEGPQVAMRLLKRAVWNAAEYSFAAACDDIATKTGISDHHPDTKEGVAAFREKRKPRFNQAKPPSH